MHIITAPHPSLRTQAQAVTQVDRRLTKFIQQLHETLWQKTKPQGVGLAAPQVDKALQVFVTKFEEQELDYTQLTPDQVFINPIIIDHSAAKNFGPDIKDPVLEGCLSIPGIYGPVPRWEWIQLEYQVIAEDQLTTRTGRFEWFPARVIQHEIDHLHGILFTDYSLEYDLPIYADDEKGKKLVEIDLTEVENL